MTIVVSQVDNLRSSFELVNVCQGWEQSVLNRIFCVGNVAQTPQAGYIWITSASLRFGRSSSEKTCARSRLMPSGIRAQSGRGDCATVDNVISPADERPSV